MRFEYSHTIFPPGLFLPVKISRIGEKSGKEINAKVDTGADISTIPDKLRKEMLLMPRGIVKASGAFDKKLKECPTFFITLLINNSFSFEIQVISSQKEYFLLGRDVLNQIILYANGPLEFFEISND